jgi:hypothetical protein
MNKSKILLILATLLVGINLFAQNKAFTATIVSDGESVNYAYVYNKPKELIIQTDYKGEFSLPVIPTDTLQFRCVGYIDTSFVVTSEMMNDEHVQLQVHKQTYALNEIKVTNFYSYASFKQAFLNLKLDDKNKPISYHIKLDPVELASARLFNGPDASGFGVSLGSMRPYFTRSEKVQQQFDNDEKKFGRLNQLTSTENIGEFTGLKGDYSIMLSVEMAYHDFLSMNTSSPDTLNVK